jgi:ABC-type transport system involved in multi-copper enzyme maturation permease subunit
MNYISTLGNSMISLAEIRETLDWFAVGCVIAVFLMALHIAWEKFTTKDPD